MNTDKIQLATKALIEAIEGETIRPEIVETPSRVARAYEEMLSGYNVDIDSLFKTFDGEGKDQIVVAKDIEVWSCCEHHLLPFHCSVSVAYLPVKRVIGVSKIARLVQAYAHRFQIQERITSQIGETLMSKLQPQGVAVVIHGEHLCMQARGAKVPSSSVVTSVMLGQFRLERTLRMEVLSLLGLGGH